MEKSTTETEQKICRRSPRILESGKPRDDQRILQNSRSSFAIVVILAMGVLLWFMSPWKFGTYQTHQTTVAKAKLRISDFSPDGKKVYLDYCDISHDCKIGWLDLATNKVALFVPQLTRDIFASPSSSDDGSKLAVVVKEAASDYKSSQVAILDLKTNSYRKVTHSYGLKEWPSFSHDGRKIIYAQAGRSRTSGKTRFSDWDIYEMDLVSGGERRLTNFCFFLVDRPMYLMDNTRFVFSGEEPSCHFPTPDTSRSHAGYNQEDLEEAQEGRSLYKQLYRENTVFMMSGNETTLKPILMNGESSFGAVLSRDGKIFFISKTNKMDNSKEFHFNYDIFSFENGAIIRLTNLRTLLTGLAVSMRGEKVAYQSDAERTGNEILWLMDAGTGTRSRIELGEQSGFTVINVTNKANGERK